MSSSEFQRHSIAIGVFVVNPITNIAPISTMRVSKELKLMTRKVQNLVLDIMFQVAES